MKLQWSLNKTFNIGFMKAKPTKHPGEVVLELNRGDETLLERASGRKPLPFRLKHILVPIDFSDCAKKALEYAIPFAREHDATVTAVYVVPPRLQRGRIWWYGLHRA